jgi:hypothetical protein
MTGPDSEAWWKTTFSGTEREQLRHFRSLPLREKLLIVEEVTNRARFLIAQRRRLGLSYFDPGTGKLMPGMAVREDRSEYSEPKDDPGRP